MYSTKTIAAMKEDAAWLTRILAVPESAGLLAELAQQEDYMFMKLSEANEARFWVIDNLVNHYSGTRHSGVTWARTVRYAVQMAQERR